MSNEPSETPIYLLNTPQENSKLKEQRITIDEKTLVIPTYIQEKMAQLDQIIANREISSEIFGIGLTRTTGSTTEIIDFINPNPNDIFFMDSLFINQDQKKLIDLLGNGQPLRLNITDNEALITTNDPENPEEQMHFPINSEGKINWSFAKTDIEKLVGLKLPKTISELKSIFQKINSNSTDTPSLSLKSDWEVITTGSSATITSAFLNKVQTRSEELNADIGFSMHHHPSLRLMRLLGENKSYSTKKSFYDDLLKYSKDDVRFMKYLDIDFFEIRAFGNPDYIANPQAGTTSRFYRTEQILKDDPFSSQ
jgi:hypothetical protein